MYVNINSSSYMFTRLINEITSWEMSWEVQVERKEGEVREDINCASKKWTRVLPFSVVSCYAHSRVFAARCLPRRPQRAHGLQRQAACWSIAQPSRYRPILVLEPDKRPLLLRSAQFLCSYTQCTYLRRHYTGSGQRNDINLCWRHVVDEPHH